MARVAVLPPVPLASLASRGTPVEDGALERRDLLACLVLGTAIAGLFQAVAQLAELPAPRGWLLVLSLVGAPLAGLGLLWAGRQLSQVWAPAPSAAKFVLVGSLNTLIDFSVFNLLLHLLANPRGWLFGVSKGLAFATAVVNSYLWNKNWCFRRSDRMGVATGRQFVLFVGVTLIGMGLNAAAATLLVHRVDPLWGLSALHWANVAAGVGLAVSTGWNFSVYRLLVFAGDGLVTNLGTRISRVLRPRLPCEHWF